MTNVTSIKEVFGIVFATFATAITSIFGAHTGIMKILIVLMAIDYAAGLIVAGVFKKSQKSKNGTIESRVSLKGLFLKGAMIIMVYIAVLLDTLLGVNYIAMATIYFYIANELISLIENFGLMGMPMPTVVKEAIEVLKKKSQIEPK